MARGQRDSVSAQDEGRQIAANAKAQFKKGCSVSSEYYEYDSVKVRKVSVISQDGIVMRKYRTFLGLMKDIKTKAWLEKMKKQSPELLKLV